MQRRLTIVLVGIALASILLVGAGVLILAQVGAREQTEQVAVERLELLATLNGDGDGRGRGQGPRFENERRGQVGRAASVIGLLTSEFVVVGPSGTTWVVPNRERRGRSFTLDKDDALLTLSETEAEAFKAGDTVVIGGGGSEVQVIRLVPTPPWIDADEASSEVAFGLVATQNVATVGRDARVWFLVSAGAVVLGSLVVSWLLARRFARPILQIEQATASIAGGDFSARVTVEGDDELSQLGNSVNAMAADLERSKALDRQFLMSVSHDLRTPLTAISGYAEALTDGAVDDTAHTGAIISNHAERLERLVGDLLDLARIDANQFQLDLQPVDAGVIVGRTVAGLTPRAEQHGLSLSFYNDGPTPVMADPDRLAQAVGNLVDNAVKFARAEVTTTVSVDSEHAVISVRDDGPGIAAEDLPFVFDRLYISSSQPERAENPSGMGLAIVRELATAMGGSVAASAVEGSGTAMTLLLPLVLSEVRTTESGTSANEPSGRTD